MAAMGLPTMLLRPTTTTSAPSIWTPERINSCQIPWGVQGRKSGSPIKSLPTFTGWKASTSFFGSTAYSTLVSSMCLRKGNWTSIPWMLGSLLYLSMRPRSASSEMSAG